MIDAEDKDMRRTLNATVYTEMRASDVERRLCLMCDKRENTLPAKILDCTINLMLSEYVTKVHGDGMPVGIVTFMSGLASVSSFLVDSVLSPLMMEVDIVEAVGGTQIRFSGGSVSYHEILNEIPLCSQWLKTEGNAKIIRLSVSRSNIEDVVRNVLAGFLYRSIVGVDFGPTRYADIMSWTTESVSDNEKQEVHNIISQWT